MKATEEIVQRTATEILNNQSGLSDFELVLIGFVLAILLIAAGWFVYWKYK